jgi:hypothetical protein
VPSYPDGFTMSNHALITLADALRARRSQVGTTGKAFVILDGTLLRIDPGRDGLGPRPAVLLR